MDYGEALQHLTRSGIATSTYRWYCIDNFMYFAPVSGIEDGLTKIMNVLFKEVDVFTVYGQYCIDLKKQIVEGSKERLIARKHRSRKDVMEEIERFTLDDDMYITDGYNVNKGGNV